MKFINTENYNYRNSDDSKCAHLFDLEANPEPGDVYEFGGKRWAVQSVGHGVARLAEIPLKEVEEHAEECYEDQITCPYCGHKDHNSFEHGDESDEEECARCCATFSFERHIEVTYSTKLVKLPAVTKVPAPMPSADGNEAGEP